MNNQEERKMKNKYLPKDTFVEILTTLKEYSEKSRAIYKAGIEIGNFTDDYHKCISHLMEHIYKEKHELVSDWIYGSWDGIFYDKTGKIITEIKTEEELWDYLEKS